MERATSFQSAIQGAVSSQAAHANHGTKALSRSKIYSNGNSTPEQVRVDMDHVAIRASLSRCTSELSACVKVRMLNPMACTLPPDRSTVKCLISSSVTLEQARSAVQSLLVFFNMPQATFAADWVFTTAVTLSAE